MLHELIGEKAMLEQTAEECCELAQACLKLARDLRGENPSSKSKEEIMKNLSEEIADVYLCINELMDMELATYESIDTWLIFKHSRIKERFGLEK